MKYKIEIFNDFDIKQLVFGNCGVLRATDLCNKAYVEMSTIDPETSQDIAEGITQSNGRYLEVQVILIFHGIRKSITTLSICFPHIDTRHPPRGRRWHAYHIGWRGSYRIRRMSFLL